MSDELTLPRGWMRTTLADVCTVITDGTHKTPHYQPSGVRFISIKNIRPFQPVNWHSYVKFISPAEHQQLTRRCKPEFDDILFPRIGTLGFAKRIDFHEEVSIFVGLGLLKPKKSLIDPKYLEYFMNGPLIARLSHEMANGSGRMTLPLEESRKFPVLLSPYPEQRRIVAKIEELFSDLDAGVAALGRVRANLKRYRAAVLKAAVEGRLTEEWRTRHPATEPAAKLLERILTERRAKWEQDQLRKFKETGKTPPKGWKEKGVDPVSAQPLASCVLPETWCWTKIGGVLTVRGGYAFKSDDYCDEGVPLIRQADLQHGRVDVECAKRLPSRLLDEYPGWTLQKGDLLVGMSGSIGKVAVYEADTPSLQNQRTGLLIPHPPMASKYLMLMMEYIVPQLLKKGKGIAVQNVSASDIEECDVPLPPLAEQAEIVAEVDRRLSVADAAETQVEHALQRAARLRQAILKRAFEGKLVPQDAADEPAAALLERIKAPSIGKHPAPAKSQMPRSRARV